MTGLREINFVFRSPFCWGKRRPNSRTGRWEIGEKNAEDSGKNSMSGKEISGESEPLMI